MTQRRMVVVGYHAAELVDIACVTSSLIMANAHGASPCTGAAVLAAAHPLASTSLPMAAIAARCGFGTAEALRQAFVDLCGIPPSRYRSTQATALPSPFGDDK